MDFKCEVSNDSMTIIIVISCKTAKDIQQTLTDEFPDNLLEDLKEAEWDDVTDTGYMKIM